MPIRPMNIARLTASAAGALLLLSACGGASASSSSTDTPADSPAVAASGASDISAYRQCMSDNGVTLPEFVGRPGGGAGGPSGAPPSGMPTDMPSGMPTGAPPSGGFPDGGGFAGGGLPDGVDQETFDAAQAACASLAPQGGGFDQRGPAGGARVDESALAAYKSCLTDHDVAIPDGDDWLRTLDRADATVKAAMETCEPLLPAPSTTGASPTSST